MGSRGSATPSKEQLGETDYETSMQIVFWLLYVLSLRDMNVKYIEDRRPYGKLLLPSDSQSNVSKRSMLTTLLDGSLCARSSTKAKLIVTSN
eukprot:1146991-Amphidinium_carterae.1